MRARSAIIAIGLLLWAASGCELASQPLTAPSIQGEDVRIVDETGLVTHHEVGIPIPAGLQVDDIRAIPAQTGEDAIDLFWFSVPCQPEATITVSGDTKRLALNVRPQPPLVTDCEASGRMRRVRLYLGVPVEDVVVLPHLEEQTLPEYH
jgi:hypothetical protein